MEIPRLFLVLLMIEVSFVTFSTGLVGGQNDSAVKVDVGVILDWDTISGKMRNACISLALSDFYANHNHTTKIVPHFRDSKSDDVEAASAAIELLKNVEVEAILGPQGSTEADFVTDIGKKVKVPVISPATTPALSPNQNPYFIRTAYCSSAQAKAIAAIIKAFGWREVVFIYENSNFGSEILPHLTDAMMNISVSVPDQSVISPSADDDQIMAELFKLKTMQTRVFIVHLSPNFASRFFSKVKEAGMMSSGYVWIITDAFTSTLVSMDPMILDSLQGVIGVKPYVPSSIELKNFTRRWKSNKFRQQNPDMDGVELNIFGLWAYDSVTALATALEKVSTSSLKFNRTISRKNSTDLDAIGTSEFGPLLIESLRNIKLRGLSGDFHIVDGELQPSAFEIVNVIDRRVNNGIGFWTEKNGISKNLYPNDTSVYSAYKDDLLGAIMWPGNSSAIPRGWENPTDGKKLKVGVPVKGGLEQFVKVTIDNHTNTVKEATGFCVDVFKYVMESMPYSVQFEYEAYKIRPGENLPNYNDLVDLVYNGKVDAVVGDITILSERSEHADFTLPFTVSGVTLVVPVKKDGAWIFLKPLEKKLWMMIAVFVVLIGTVIWVFEHRENPEFQGSIQNQLGMIFWFSISCPISPDKDKVKSNLSRFVIIVWMLVVLVLISSYTANLASMLTVQGLQPTVSDVKDLIKNRKYVGCQDGSFVAGMLTNMGFESKRIRNYTTLEEYDEALGQGSGNGGVDAIMDELPYLRLFLQKYPQKYTLVGPSYKNAGFGFAFPRGSSLVPDVSRAILRVTESDAMMRIEEKWFGDETHRSLQEVSLNIPESLPLDRFKELFFIAGGAILLALIVFFVSFINENKAILTSDISIWHKLSALAKAFLEKKEASSREAQKPNEDVVSSPELAMTELRHLPIPETANIAHFPRQDVFSQDAGSNILSEPDDMIPQEIVNDT